MAKLYLVSHEPAVSKSVASGSTVSCELVVECQLIPVNGYFGIKYNGTDCASKYNVWHSYPWRDSVSCSFKMPTKTTVVTFYGGHSEGGSWIEDFKKTVTLTPPAPPKGFIYSYKYEIDGVEGSANRDVDVGKTVKLKEVVYNTGGSKGYISCQIKRNGAECTGFNSKDTEVGYANRWSCDCSFTMPEGVAKLNYYTHHWDGSKWVQDAQRVITLTGVKKTCSQSFHVKRYENGVWSDASYAKVKIGAYTWGCDFYGKLTKTLEEGGSYTAEALKTGYECYDGECRKTFTACVSEIILKFKKSAEFCNQYVKVTDQYGSGVPGVWVKCNSDTRETGVTGKCTFNNLTKDKTYTLVATAPEGYTCVECTKTFTACIAEITLKLNKEEVPPEKKDTEIDFFDVQDIEGASVRKLYVGKSYYWKAWLYEYALIGHGDPIKGRKIEIVRTDTGAILFAGNTQSDGGIVGGWTVADEHKGAYKVQAKFAGDDEFNACESGTFDIEVISAPERGVEVVVNNVPTEGLKVLIAPYKLMMCNWIEKTEKTIYSDLESVMFDLTAIEYKGVTKACIQVKNMADVLMDELKAESIPASGTTTKHMSGYLGSPYRTWLGVSPRTPSPGKSFTLTAHLIKNPKETVGKDFEVIFYEVVDETEERIGANLTDETGKAIFMTSKSEAGTYTYVARYSGADTFAESITVTVSAVSPCPIEEAFREVCPLVVVYGCVIHPDLVTLRAFRDAVLPRFVVKAYYAMGPLIIIFFVNNRVSKWFVRKAVHLVARRVRKRWGY